MHQGEGQPPIVGRGKVTGKAVRGRQEKPRLRASVRAKDARYRRRGVGLDLGGILGYSSASL